MAYTYEELSKMTVVQLRDVAHGIEREELKGIATMHKEKLLPLLCKVMNIEVFHRHVVGINKSEIKQKIRQLKVQREEAIQKKDKKELQAVRKQIHDLKRELRKHMI